MLTPGVRALAAELSGDGRRRLQEEAQDAAAAICLWFLGGASAFIGLVISLSPYGGGDPGQLLFPGGLLVAALGWATLRGYRLAAWAGFLLEIVVLAISAGPPPADSTAFLVGLFALTRLARWPPALRDVMLRRSEEP